MVKSKSQEKVPKVRKSKSKRMQFPIKPINLMIIVSLVIAIWIGYKGYLQTRINTPYNGKKAFTGYGLDSLDRYWGTYRSGVYFGLKTRDPHSLVTGLMWYFPRFLRHDGTGFRHWCEQGDELDRYAWLEHDGRTFGVQEIVDDLAVIRTTFVKKPGGYHGGDWTARIAVSANKEQVDEEMSLLFYTAIEEDTRGWIKANLGDYNRLTGIEGNTFGLGSFIINVNLINGTIEEHSFLATVAPGLNMLKETVFQSLRIATQKGSMEKHVVLAGEQLPLLPEGKKKDPNFIVTQVTGKIPFEIEISYESGSFTNRMDVKLTGNNYDEALKNHRELFSKKFENVFKLKSKGYTDDEVAFAKMAFSNLIGSIGYFYGASQVQSIYNQEPVPYWKAPLYTAVPSRSFFPRGFLWDEGFHGLLISAWDVEIEIDIIKHWFDLMNVEGWIPREMILGQEAVAKVPEEFITQINTNANPPTFFLTLDFLLQHKQQELLKHNNQLLIKLYPRLQKWFSWFNTTQVGELPSTYRWRGREEKTTEELNPTTLTSGLDDYPRASHPSVAERHVDLRCWIAFAARVMARLAETLSYSAIKYQETFEYLSDNNLLNNLHWSPNAQAYSDYGLHTDKVVLRKIALQPSRKQQSAHIQMTPEMKRIVLENPSLKFVDATFGYVSLFPFILQIVEPDSPQLGKILQDLRDPDLLWTKYGLRSLAKTSPLYMKYNTEHDAPYWRGSIWINLNYLTVRAAYHYSNVTGPYQESAKRLYQELRKNLIQNIIMQYRKTGYLWEQYDSTEGKGKGSHPFTGWTSLVVLLMAEIY
ncbi:PREDICTED: mannosyl-oligosaccharide glucosidase GCS1 [Trachymyrmex cornetzi]|nr:PREDICTED: mannosyl-oligosaccharide glucosidase GCS1 [Trachymyrmex cornetzi]